MNGKTEMSTAARRKNVACLHINFLLILSCTSTAALPDKYAPTVMYLHG